MRQRDSTPAALIGNPVLVGAVTVLVTVVAVFLAYNANKGLPFVPTSQLNAIVPDGQRLVEGNEVREGGYRIGVVDRIEPLRLEDGTAGARLVLRLDQKATPLPADSRIRIRTRSALGLKYVELQRGGAADTLADGSTIELGSEALTFELQDFFNIFDEETRANSRRNLVGFGDALASRGPSINRALEELPAFLRAAPPVMRVLSDPDTRLARLFRELGDAARVSAPVAETIADGFAAAADTFEALSRHPQALRDTIARSPGTLEVGTRSLRAQRPFLADLADVSDDLQGAARELRRSAGPVTSALRAGIDPLRRSPALNRRLDATFDALADLAEAPGTNRALAGLTETMATLDPQLRYLGPFVTVCNYWNHFWTYLADHLTDEDQTGTIQRVQAKSVSEQDDTMASFGAPEPANAENPEPGSEGHHYHAQFYGAAVNERGEADCESGQRGYPRRLASGMPEEYDIVIDPATPGDQGPTFRGRPRVLPGQTFSRVPETGPRLRP